jgi:nucleoside transporter
MSHAEMDRKTALPLPLGLNVRLSIMFFLQYAIWGAWLTLLLPYLGGHRHFEPSQIANIFAVGALGNILAPFLAGQIADRYFSTERYLAISHWIGAVLIWQLAGLETYTSFLWFSLAYSVVYSPTLSLTNSLAFHHLPDRDRHFGRVRVWGTIGWICAGIAVAQWLRIHYTPADAVTEIEKATAQSAGIGDAFRLSAILGAIMGTYCFFLPHTPPQRGRQKFATWEARGEVQRNSRLLGLFLFAIVISCIHQFYFYHTANFLRPFQNAAGDSAAMKAINTVFGLGGGGLMTIGQMSELVVLAFMPLIISRFSRKTFMAVGITAYAVRMGLFAYVNQITSATEVSALVPLVIGLTMHGLCFGCFMFVAYLVIDEETTSDVRASAQGLLNLVIFGLGIIVGSMIAAIIQEWATATVGAEQVIDYTKLFGVPMWASLLTLVAFWFLYPGKKMQNSK